MDCIKTFANEGAEVVARIKLFVPVRGVSYGPGWFSTHGKSCRNLPRGNAAQEGRRGKHAASCRADVGFVAAGNQAGYVWQLDEKGDEEQGDEEDEKNAQDDGQDVARQPVVGALRLGRGVGAIDLDGSIVAPEERGPLAGRGLIRHVGQERRTVPALKQDESRRNGRGV